ncbi:hypothetical protein D3C78_1338470 [compost metagenome]
MQVAACAQCRDFGHQAGGQHGVEALGDARVQPAALAGFEREQRGDGRAVVAGRAGLGLVKMRQRLAGNPEDFERALDALAVAGREPGRRDGVDLGQLGMHAMPADGSGLCFELGAHGRIGRGHVVHAVEQGLEVQHGAADQQRQRTARADFGDQALGILDELGGAVGLQRVADIDQVVGHGGLLGSRWLGRTDIHAAVD